MGELLDLRNELEATAWPTLDPATRHGLAGEIIAALEPHTEADPAALLIDFLVSFGNVIGRRPHRMVDSARHGTNLFAIIVGKTGDGRKGTARANIRRLFADVDNQWADELNRSGYASGEAIIADLADTADRRRLIVEPEFASVLARMKREGQVLSPTWRDCWDGNPLANRRSKDVVVVRDHHVSFVGHCTPGELTKRLTETEQSNGFANRFAYVLSRRSNILPEGGSLTDTIVTDLSAEIREAVDRAQQIGPMRRSDEAKDFWADLYRSLIEEERERHGLYGDLTGRAAAQQTRLQMVYACLDGTDVIGPEHVNAAAAMWDYCDASVQWVFADRSGDRIEDKLLEAIVKAGHEGLSRKEQSGLFHRNIDAATLEAARDRLIQAGAVFTKQYRNSKGGRPVTCEIATKHRDAK